MNFEAEKRKIKSLNKEELREYEAENTKLLLRARREVEKAEEERRKPSENMCFFGKAEDSLIKTVLAYSKEKRLLDLNAEIQKRKLSFLTPQEKRAREQKRKNLFNRLEVLKA